jgi:DeoR/GlpR family transcriptional regulator of sugar metabolism
MSDTRPALPAQRRQEMLRAVRGGQVHVGDLAESFGVSEMTVRRDLGRLASEGKLERVRGGAVEADAERPFAETAVEHFDGKDRMGAAAAALLHEGQTVMVDIGTTTLQAARHLRGRALTVVTSSLAVYEELLADPSIELVLPGGVVRRNYRSLVGPLAEDALRQLGADVLLLGASAIDAEGGVWDSTMVEVPIKRAMIAGAARVVLLADQRKFDRSSAMRICGLDAVDHIVTDAPLPAGAASLAREAGIEVTVA